MSPLTGVLREAWATYKTYAAHFLVIAFVLYLVAAAIAALLSAAFGLAGSVAAFLLYDYFFVPPVGTFTVSGPRELLELIVLLAVALVTS